MILLDKDGQIKVNIICVQTREVKTLTFMPFSGETSEELYSEILTLFRSNMTRTNYMAQRQVVRIVIKPKIAKSISATIYNLTKSDVINQIRSHFTQTKDN